MNKASGAVLWAGEKSMSVEEIEVEDPRPDEVLVKVFSSGVCHTDMVMRDQHVPTPQPVVLGHEGSGVIEKVGKDVTEFEVGDHVSMSFATCGTCPSCSDGEPSYCYEFFPRNFFGTRADGTTSITCKNEKIHSHIFGQSSFSTKLVCHKTNLVKIDKDFPLELAGPFGCGFQTGAGAVLNSLKVRSDSTVMVLGTGTVGMCAIMAAKIAGASKVIAVDLHESRLQTTLEVGATDTVNLSSAKLSDSIEKIAPNKIDYVVDTTGHIPLIEEAIQFVAPRGAIALAAAYRPDAKMTFDVMPFMSTGLTIRGVVEGDTDIKTFIPKLVSYYKAGKFPIDKIVKKYSFEEINQAIEDSESGEAIKAILLMPA